MLKLLKNFFIASNKFDFLSQFISDLITIFIIKTYNNFQKSDGYNHHFLVAHCIKNQPNYVVTINLHNIIHIMD